MDLQYKPVSRRGREGEKNSKILRTRTSLMDGPFLKTCENKYFIFILSTRRVFGLPAIFGLFVFPEKTDQDNFFPSYVPRISLLFPFLIPSFFPMGASTWWGWWSDKWLG